MILDEIVKDKKKRLIEDKSRISEAKMKELAKTSKRESISFYHALKKEGLSIIGEFKQASPSMGIIDNKLTLEDRIQMYTKSVDAISCLTEVDHFHGNADDLKKIRAMTDLPILRKDFIIDEYQIYEAKVIGADAILLIAAILSDEKLVKFYQLAESLGLDVLLEVHDEEELQRALKVNPKILGVNNRNLKDFSIQLDTTKQLVEYFRTQDSTKETVFVSESGVTKATDVEFLKQFDVNALLIGRAFMEAENPEQLAKEWKAIYE